MNPKNKALLLPIFALFLACAPKEKQLRLRFWGDIEEIKITEALVQDFEKSHPGIKVRCERKPADHSYGDVLLSEFVAGNAPDVIFVSTNDFAKFAAGGHFSDLNPWVEKDEEFKKTDFYPVMCRAFERDGALLALPRDTSPVAVIYYNKKLFKDAGLPLPADSWDCYELRNTALKLTKRDKKGRASQLGYAEEWNLAESWMLAAGGGMMDDPFKPTRFSADSPASLEGLNFRYLLQNVDRSMPAPGDDRSLSDSGEALFMSGRLAMFYSGIWKTPQFRKIKDFDWDVAMFPKGPHGKRGFVTGGSGYAMNAQSKDKQLAWELMRHVGGPEGMRRMAATGLIQPALRPLASSPAFLDGQKPLHKAMLLQAADLGTLSPQAPFYQEFIADIWSPVTEPLWIGDSPPSEVRNLASKAVALAQAKYFPKKSE